MRNPPFLQAKKEENDKVDLANGPKAAYQSMTELDLLKRDQHQVLLVEKLQELFNRIRGYQPYKPGFFEKVCTVSSSWH